MMLAHFAPVNWVTRTKPPRTGMQYYVVKEGDTLAGIALRHNLRESDLRAMNNLSSSSAIFCGQELRVRRKQRSHSVPVLPFADRIDNQAQHVADTDTSSNNDNTGEVHVPHDIPQLEELEASSDTTQSKQAAAPRPAASFQPETPPTHTPTLMRRTQQRSKSERLYTHHEDDDICVPRLLGGAATEVLMDARYGAKLVPQLEASLAMRYRGYDWSLLYSLAEHGASLHTLLRRVRSQSPTLVVVETTSGDVFGGFATVPWTPAKSYYGTGESFVFTCQPHFEYFPWARTNAMFMLSSNAGIGMGGGGGFAWFANADLSHGSSAASATFANRPLATASDFEIASVEVWGFVPKM